MGSLQWWGIIAVIAKLLKVKFSKISLLLIKLPLVIRFKLSAEIVESLLILASKSATVIVKVETLSSCLFVKSPLVLKIDSKLFKENADWKILIFLSGSYKCRELY